MVQCVKLGHEAEGMTRPPFNNELGQRIFENVSKEGWKLWLGHSTMLINEYRIDLQSKEGTKFLLEQAEKFFFGGEVAQASGYVPIDPSKGDPSKSGGSKVDSHGRAPGDAHYGHDHAGHDHHDHAGHDHGAGEKKDH
jgi:Fe-S cluster biosynthesis and repair protein YggX